MSKHCYITRRPYNHHPIGSKCFAFRVDNGSKLLLEFVDGDIIELSSDLYPVFDDMPWATGGIESDLVPIWTEEDEDTLGSDELEPVNEMIMAFRRG